MPPLILGPRRLALIAVIAAVALTIIFYPLIVASPINPDKVDIKVGKVELISGNAGEQKLVLGITFNTTNRNDITLTIARIDYSLSADGISLGNNTLSYEDVPLNGRPALFSGTSVPLKDSSFTLQYSDQNAAIFNKISKNISQVKWIVTGSTLLDSGTTEVPKQFSSQS
jgi:hypothetical protein